VHRELAKEAPFFETWRNNDIRRLVFDESLETERLDAMPLNGQDEQYIP
jgi:hypothetical protein